MTRPDTCLPAETPAGWASRHTARTSSPVMRFGHAATPTSARPAGSSRIATAMTGRRSGSRRPRPKSHQTRLSGPRPGSIPRMRPGLPAGPAPEARSTQVLDPGRSVPCRAIDRPAPPAPAHQEGRREPAAKPAHAEPQQPRYPEHHPRRPGTSAPVSPTASARASQHHRAAPTGVPVRRQLRRSADADANGRTSATTGAATSASRWRWTSTPPNLPGDMADGQVRRASG